MRRNISWDWIRLAAFFAVLSSVGCAREEITISGKHTIEKDATWAGTLILEGDVYVPPGVTLTILPGTMIKFKKIDAKSDRNMFDVDSPYYPEAELIIRGRLIAKGTKKERIVFTSAERNPRPADWGAVNFLGSDGNELEYVKIFCAYNGIHAHGSTVTISHSEFVGNGVGISFKSEEETPGVPWFGKRSHLTITRNHFTKNKGGIGFRNSDGVISHNEIVENKFFGLWPKEDLNIVVTRNDIRENQKGIYLFQAKGIRFEYNNIYDNRDYDIGVAEAQDFDVDARNNYFGTTDRQKIDKMIFDKADDQDLAEIAIDPILSKPVEDERGV